MRSKQEKISAESIHLLEKMGDLKRNFPVGTCVRHPSQGTFVIVNYFDHVTEERVLEHCVGFTKQDGSRGFGPITMLENVTQAAEDLDQAWIREALAAKALRLRATALLKIYREDIRTMCRLPYAPTLSGLARETVRRRFFHTLAEQFPRSYPVEAAPQNTAELSPVTDSALINFLEKFFQRSTQQQEEETSEKKPHAEAPTEEGYFLFQNQQDLLTLEIDGEEIMLCTLYHVMKLLQQTNPGITVSRKQARDWANRHVRQFPFLCKVVTQAARAGIAGTFTVLRNAAAYDVEEIRTALPHHPLTETGVPRLNEKGWMVLESEDDGEAGEGTVVWSAGKWCAQHGLDTDLYAKILRACGVKPVEGQAYDGPQSRQRVNRYREEDLTLHRTLLLANEGIEFQLGKDADQILHATTIGQVILKLSGKTGAPTKAGMHERRVFFGMGERDTQDVEPIREGELWGEIKKLHMAPITLQRFLDADATLAPVGIQGRNLVRVTSGDTEFLLTVKKTKSTADLADPANTVCGYRIGTKEADREELYGSDDMMRAVQACHAEEK